MAMSGTPPGAAPRTHTRLYRCGACGEVHQRWSARCTKCLRIGLEAVMPTMLGEAAVEMAAEAMALVGDPPAAPAPAAPRLLPSSSSEPVLLSNVAIESFARTLTNMAPLDAVLGGGLVAGVVLLLGGLPGCGKSTLTTIAMAGLGERVLYATGEETVAQVADRALRIGVTNAKIYVVRETDLDIVLEHARKVRAAVIVVDSIQTMQCSAFNGPVGSPNQVKGCTTRLIDFAKETDVSIWMIGHVTSDGSLAGPSFLKHMVDVVLEMDNERGNARLLRCASKNRFGRTTVIGKFTLTDTGIVPNGHYDSSEGPDPELEPEPTDDVDID